MPEKMPDKVWVAPFIDGESVAVDKYNPLPGMTKYLHSAPERVRAGEMRKLLQEIENTYPYDVVSCGDIEPCMQCKSIINARNLLHEISAKERKFATIEAEEKEREE